MAIVKEQILVRKGDTSEYTTNLQVRIGDKNFVFTNSRVFWMEPNDRQYSDELALAKRRIMESIERYVFGDPGSNVDGDTVDS